jgi:hypothetical protein
MGDRQSMVVLNGWYIYQSDEVVYKNPRLCKALRVVNSETGNYSVYWADIERSGYANSKWLTSLPEGLTPILSDSISNKEDV